MIKNKKNLDKDLVHTIDQLIIDTGSYQPVELLLRLNLLAYADYEQWCMGKTRYLSDSLNQNNKEIIRTLDEASSYANSLNLIAEPMIIHQWQQNETNQIPSFCPDNSLFSNYLSSQYVRQDDEQMDLFFDNQSLSIIKELKQALISRNVKLASQQFQALYQNDPEHEMFQPARILLDALVNALEEEPITDPAEEMRYLLEELKPLAEKVLSGKQRDYMSLFWRRLAAYIDDDDYKEDDKIMHSSFCYQQIPDWQAVINSIEKTSGNKKQPELSARLSLALNKSGQHKAFIQSVFQFCWQFPAILEQTPDKAFITADATLKKNWYAFLDQELDQQWGIAHFPDWLLINDPGINHYIASCELTPESFTLLQQLILSEVKDEEKNITLRKQLNQAYPGILKFYLKSI